MFNCNPCLRVTPTKKSKEINKPCPIDSGRKIFVTVQCNPSKGTIPHHNSLKGNNPKNNVAKSGKSSPPLG